MEPRESDLDSGISLFVAASKEKTRDAREALQLGYMRRGKETGAYSWAIRYIKFFIRSFLFGMFFMNSRLLASEVKSLIFKVGSCGDPPWLVTFPPLLRGVFSCSKEDWRSRTDDMIKRINPVWVGVTLGFSFGWSGCCIACEGLTAITVSTLALTAITFVFAFFAARLDDRVVKQNLDTIETYRTILKNLEL